ncbi:MAG: hypothetical protein DLM64_10300 [Solirubrobacterales bacterium]|nr:MAG: hypothetical protein DLM64_10300 [Solirubrobacterales bacterium]
MGDDRAMKELRWVLVVAVVVGVIVTVPMLVLASGGSGRPHAPVHATPPAPQTPTSLPVGDPAPARIGTWGHGSWCWFQDPRAVHVASPVEATFVGWIDWSGRVTVGAYATSTGAMRTHVLARLYHDDHGAPAILVEPDKRLTVFYSGHDGAEMDYRTTLRPEDISAWGPVQRVPSGLRGRLGFTYPNPLILPAEGDKLYLFWRGAQWGSDYATRTRDGHWSPARHLIEVHGERPYVKFDSNGNDAIGLAFTNGHPRNVLTNVYYAAYRDGALWHAGGRRIARLAGRAIRPKEADLVYNARAGRAPAWVWDVAIGSGQHPVIVYATFPSRRNHDYWYARWTGGRWRSHLITSAGPSISPGTIEYEYSGGITLDHSNPSVVFLSRKVRSHYQIERWNTPDGGQSWSHAVVVRGGKDNVRPVVPRGWTSGSMGLLWLRGDYRSYTTYRTSVAFER